jgi:hypothetical protein
MNTKILLVGAQSYLMLCVSNLNYMDLYKYHRTSTVIMEHKLQHCKTSTSLIGNNQNEVFTGFLSLGGHPKPNFGFFKPLWAEDSREVKHFSQCSAFWGSINHYHDQSYHRFITTK